jgi:hypothetical protein
VIVAIPSKGRPTGVKSQKLITSAVVFVPEYEVRDYESAGVRNVVGVPAEIRGITRTRNWILDNVEDSRVVFVDDDLKVQGWVEFYAHTMKHRKLTEEVWLAEWEKLFDVAEEMGFRIWGTSTDGAPRSVYPWKPFIWHTYVTASCMGILNDERRTRFDESFPVKEDYELCLRCIKEDGGVVGARYLYWVNSHWTDEGGCRDYRTQEMEREAIERLMKMYPGLIRKVTRGGSEYSIELDF